MGNAREIIDKNREQLIDHLVELIHGDIVASLDGDEVDVHLIRWTIQCLYDRGLRIVADWDDRAGK